MMEKVLICRFVLRRMLSLINFRIQLPMPHESRTKRFTLGTREAF